MTDFVILSELRQNAILKIIQSTGAVTCTGLSSQFNVSKHTVRRDLKELANKNMCKRVHGGAIKILLAVENFENRIQEKNPEKKTIANKAALLIKNKGFIFLDSSSINVKIAKSLPKNTGITVVTNSPAIANEVSKKRQLYPYFN